MRQKKTPDTDSNGYLLLDAGNGLKLEQWGALRLVRPAPAATSLPKLEPLQWDEANGRFIAEEGWQWEGTPPQRWIIAHGGFQWQCRPAAAGQVGLFPEQAALWALLASAGALAPLGRTLSLFAYTGAATVAAARAGAEEVAHVDAAKTAVTWARENGLLNGLAEKPIRWIADDALGFVQREARRERRYDTVILDPPSFGRSGSKTWKFERDLPALIQGVAAVLSDKPRLVLLSAHTEGWKAHTLAQHLRGIQSRHGGKMHEGSLDLAAQSGAMLPGGAYACWESEPR